MLQKMVEKMFRACSYALQEKMNCTKICNCVCLGSNLHICVLWRHKRQVLYVTSTAKT